METYTFNGKILPERVNFTISEEIPFTLEAIDANIKFDAIVSIRLSQVSVLVKTETEDLATLRNYVENLVRYIADSFGYLNGVGYDVSIDTVTTSKGQQIVWGVGIEELEKEKNKRPLNINQLLVAVQKSPHLRRALADLREAIISSQDTGFFCYRAIESVAQYFKTGKDITKNDWEKMRTDLRIGDRKWIDEVKDAADLPRHGGVIPHTTGPKRVLLMQRAWTVVDRFSIYVNQDFKPLSDSYELLN